MVIILLLSMFWFPIDAQKESLRSRLQRHLKASMQEMEDRLRVPQSSEGASENSSSLLTSSGALTVAKEPGKLGTIVVRGF